MSDPTSSEPPIPPSAGRDSTAAGEPSAASTEAYAAHADASLEAEWAYDDEQPTDDLAYPTGDEDWQEEPLPGRPRRRMLTPLTAVLFATVVGGGGFIAGVEVEKGQVSSSSSGTGLLRAASGATGAAGAGRAGGFAGLSSGGGSSTGGGSQATVGTVASISPPNIYVTDSAGNTIKVITSSGSTITRQVSGTANQIHSGDNVVVTGLAQSDGSVVASSVRDSGSGGSTGGGLAGLFGGSGAGSSSSRARTGSSTNVGGATGTGSGLFGSG